MTGEPMYQPQLFGGEHIETGEADSDWWCTPESSIGASMFGMTHVRAFYAQADLDGEPIDLDPCSNIRSTVGARIAYTLSDDGLSKPWTLHRRWVNPPYSDCGPWLARCQSSVKTWGGEALALVKGDWSTSWWQDYVRTATARCELSTRVRFVVPEGANGSPPWPSVLVYWGPRLGRFARMFGDIGEVIEGTVPPGTEQPSGDLPSAPGYSP